MEFFDFSNFGFRVIFFVVIGLLAIWDTVWKGFGLWKAAKNNHAVWFICILVFNTLGILPIIYILLNRDKK